MGHEAAGEIVETGADVSRFKAGDRVTFDSTEFCGSCWHCLRGEQNLCDHRSVLGVSCAEYRRDGAFAEYLVLPDRILHALPQSLDYESAALAEPVSVAVHAASLESPGIDESAVIVGAGLIGLLLLQVLRGATAGRIIAVDPDPQRRKTALGFGADAALDPGDPGLMDGLAALGLGRGADRAYEAVGATASIGTAIACLRKGGTLTLIGNANASVELPLQSVVTRQLKILGSCAISGEYPKALDLMARGKVDARRLVSAVAPLSEGAAWFARLYEREPGLLKVVLVP